MSRRGYGATAPGRDGGGMSARKIIAIEVHLENGTSQRYTTAAAGTAYLCILENHDFNNIAMTGGRERQVVMAKILETLTTERLMEINRPTEETGQ
jgi:hypothetical protein